MSLRKFFFENEAVVGIKSPSDYLYIKTLRLMLANVSSWPRKEIGEPEPYYQDKALKVFYLFVSVFALAGFIYHVFTNTEQDFLTAGHMYLVVLMSTVNMSRVMLLTWSTKYRELGKQFLTKTHLFFYKDRSEYAMKIHKRVHLISHVVTLFLTAQMFFGLSLYNLIPMYVNYAAGRYKSGGTQNSSFEHSMYFPYPFNTSTDMGGYIFACIVHWWLSYLTSNWFVMFDLFLALMVFNIWGHFKILINMLNDFARPSANSNTILENGVALQAKMYTKEELLQVSERLKECINYHREIVQFTDAVSDVFGPMLFVYYAFHQASGCLLFLECSQMTAPALMRYLPLTIIVTQQLIQLSVIFELIGTESGKIKDAVYGIPWESMGIKNRKVVIVFLMNVQEPIHVKALGIANVGVTSMAMILKTTMSYFMFLRSM